MANAPLTNAELRQQGKALRKRQAELTGELRRQTDLVADVRDARSDSTSDDEHDPEGSTLTTEWSRIAGLQREFQEELAAIDRALQRIDDGSYGLCTRRGEPIGRARLEARPTAELCIDCARELEARR